MSDNFDIRTAADGIEKTFSYTEWRHEIIDLISHAKNGALLQVNSAMLSMYWSIGNSILSQQKLSGWGKQVIPRLARDLAKKFPTDKGFSERNLKYMRNFAESYPDFPVFNVSDGTIVQVPLAQITWYHHITLLSKIKNPAERAFYITETARNGWSRNVMLHHIDNNYINAKGHAINNFGQTLPASKSQLAENAFRDPYIFNFIGRASELREREIEHRMISRIKDFLLEMGRGFAFVGNQYPVIVDGDTYYIDILMYHLQLHCYVVVELKGGEFLPEYVSKLNFYISAVDEKIKTPEDNPTIGLLMCRTKSNEKARLALKGFTQPLGITQYETEKLFADVASALPTINDIEQDFLDNE